MNQQLQDLAIEAARRLVVTDQLAQLLEEDKAAFTSRFGGNLPVDGWLESLGPRRYIIDKAEELLGRELTEMVHEEFSEALRNEIGRVLGIS